MPPWGRSIEVFNAPEESAWICGCRLAAFVPGMACRKPGARELRVTGLISSSWEHFAHGSDIGVRGRGPTKEAAFEQAAMALTAVITDLPLVRTDVAVSINCEAPADDLLLVDWLNAIVYEMSTRRMLFSGFLVTIDGSQLKATAWGEGVDRARHEPAVEVKGATYTELRVERLDDGQWLAQCVVDV
jgi:tRNA nucleotidyltransferase (CCA-adding enzyme)